MRRELKKTIDDLLWHYQDDLLERAVETGGTHYDERIKAVEQARAELEQDLYGKKEKK